MNRSGCGGWGSSRCGAARGGLLLVGLDVWWRQVVEEGVVLLNLGLHVLRVRMLLVLGVVGNLDVGGQQLGAQTVNLRGQFLLQLLPLLLDLHPGLLSLVVARHLIRQVMLVSINQGMCCIKLLLQLLDLILGGCQRLICHSFLRPQSFQLLD